MIKRRLFREEHESFRDTVRKLIEREISPFHYIGRSMLCARKAKGSHRALAQPTRVPEQGMACDIIRRLNEGSEQADRFAANRQYGISSGNNSSKE